MKNKIAYLFIISALLCCSCNENQNFSDSSSSEEEENFEIYKIHSSLQSQYLNDDYYNIFNYASGNEELSKPYPVVIKTNVFENISKVDKYVVELSHNKDFSSSDIYETKSLRLNLYNLFIGYKYYYRITAFCGENQYVSETKRFMIEDICPRNINVDGVTNFRDLGGYKTKDNKVVKQGLIYRSGALGYSTNTFYITDEGSKTYKNQLNIKTEIDLRTNEVNTTSYVDGVNYYHFPMDYSYTYFPNYSSAEGALNNYASIRDVFKAFANEVNYPCNFHCQIGTDRTGFIAFTLLNLLNVDTVDIYYDFLFSNFGNIQAKRDMSPISDYLNALNSYNGESIQDKTKEYLKDIGVNDNEINDIINNLTE